MFRKLKLNFFSCFEVPYPPVVEGLSEYSQGLKLAITCVYSNSLVVFEISFFFKKKVFF